MVKINLAKIELALLIALGIVLLLNAFLSAKPAKLQLTVIEDKNCKDCFDIAPVVDSIKKANVELIKEDNMDLSSAKALISKYDIRIIPAIIITGEINKTDFKDFEEKDNALLFSKQTPPYTDAVSGKIKGRVSLIHLKDKSCDKCTDLTSIIESIKQNAKLTDEKIVDISSAEGKNLVEKYDIEKAPTLILSKDLSFYAKISEAWSQIGTVEGDGSYIIRVINPPYVNISANETVGLVDLIMLKDKSCANCYDVTVHKPILQNLGTALNSEKTIDIADKEGKELIEKYKIKLVPTIILSNDADAYPALKQVWGQVGSIEGDGTYVFRGLAVMGVAYKNLTSGEVVG